MSLKKTQDSQRKVKDLCICGFPGGCDKLADMKQHKGRAFTLGHTLRGYSSPWLHEWDAVLHTVATVRTQIWNRLSRSVSSISSQKPQNISFQNFPRRLEFPF